MIKHVSSMMRSGQTYSESQPNLQPSATKKVIANGVSSKQESQTTTVQVEATLISEPPAINARRRPNKLAPVAMTDIILKKVRCKCLPNYEEVSAEKT